MQDLISGKVLEMSSREICELTGKAHKNVLEIVRSLIDGGVLKSSRPSTWTHGVNKQTYPEFLCNKRDSLIIVARLSPEFTAAVVDRWQELEQKQSVPENPLLQLANAVLTAQKVIDEQSSRLALAEPKAAAFELITNAEGELCLTDAAKHLQLSPSKLIFWLQANKWIYKRDGSKSWVAYQNRIDQGLLVHRRASFTRSSGVDDFAWQALVTPKGIKPLSMNTNIQEMQK